MGTHEFLMIVGIYLNKLLLVFFAQAYFRCIVVEEWWGQPDVAETPCAYYGNDDE
jgi:hypothetical protein